MNAALRVSLAPLVAALVLAMGPGVASAHPTATSAVLLDIQSEGVRGEIQLPLDRLAVALDRALTPAAAAGSLRHELERYARAHVRAVGTDGQTWTVAVGSGHVEPIGSVEHFVVPLSLTPPAGKVTDFSLQYDVIVERLVTHRAIATIRTQWSTGTFSTDPVALGVFDRNTRSLPVDAVGGSWLRGFMASAELGLEHIAEGADHLLFLLMLLLPAPLVARAGRWHQRNDARGSAVRVVHVVTAFAIGHSLTLALATFGLIDVSSRVVESLIAVSILVSAIHAVRPLVPGGEAIIAAGFGLVHGIAFAALLGDIGLRGGALVSLLLGFNLGIEVTQLLVVALMMPSLYVLSRTALYMALRVWVAVFGVVLSAAWLLERATLVDSDPFAPISRTLIEHPFTVVAAFALLAVVAHYGRIPRAIVGRSR